MVGVKRPARDTDRPSSKKLKVLNSATPRRTRTGTNSSKNLPAQSPASDSASTNDASDSDLSAEGDGEDLKAISGNAKPNEVSKSTRADDAVGNAVLNGWHPCYISILMVANNI
jgi:hypothetical protein